MVATELMGDEHDTKECSNFRFSLQWLLRMRLLGCFVEGLTNWRNISLPSSGSKSKPSEAPAEAGSPCTPALFGFLLGFLFYTEDGGNIFLWTVRLSMNDRCSNPEDCPRHISKWWSIWSSVFWGVITHTVSSSGMWCVPWQISQHFRGTESQLWEPQTQHYAMKFGTQVTVLFFFGPLSPASLLTSPGSCPLFPTSCITIFHIIYSSTWRWRHQVLHNVGTYVPNCMVSHQKQ
jgi:hypothetical protein